MDEPVQTADPGTAAAPVSTPEPSLSADLAASTPSLSQADFDAKLAEARKGWEAESGQKYGWAKDIPTERGQTFVEFMRLAETDPIAAAQHLLQLATQQPEYAPAVQQFLSNLTAGLPATAQAASTTSAQPDPEPGPDKTAKNQETGELTELYSAGQLAKWQAWHSRQLEAKFDAKLRPLSEFRDQTVAAEQKRDAERQASQLADSTLAQMAKRPGFTEHKAEIAKAFEAMIAANPNLDAGTAIRDAYHDVVYPTLTAGAASEALATEARKAAATTARPQGARAATPTVQPTLAEDLSAEWAKYQRKGA